MLERIMDYKVNKNQLISSRGRNIFNKFLCISLIFFGNAFAWARSSPGAVINSPSCLQADVQAAISASSDGDTVMVPAGTCTWGTGGTSASVNKSITLQGNGIDSTVINLASSAPTYTNGTVAISAARATVKGFTFNAPSGTTTATVFAVSGNNFRIGQNRYNGANGICTGYFAYIDDAYGVIDSNTIVGSAGNQELIFTRGASDSWQTSRTLGEANNIFIENNTFSNAGYVTDCNSNSRCVVRYNTIFSPSKIDAHGKCSNTPPRGARHTEIYGNEWTLTSGYFAAIEVRSGTGMIFYNKADNANGSSWFMLRDYATFQTGCNGYMPNCCCPSDYPCDDQIGVGIDPKSAASEPFYSWMNFHSSATWPIEKGDSQISGGGCNVAGKCGTSYSAITQIADNRDFYSYNASFDGSSGVGCGTLASRPGTCTAGVGYWATNQSCSDLTGMIGAHPTEPISGTLYRCTSTNTWTAYYTPYTYPHPLTLSPDSEPPAAPTGLSVK